MPRDLISLIKASGGAGIAGQTFESNVTGAASGVRMTDYNISSWQVDSGSSDAPSDGLQVADGHTFNFIMDITRGSKASNIQRLGAVLTTTVTSGITGHQANLVVNNVLGATANVQIQVRGKLVSTNRGISSWWDGYSGTNAPPDDGMSHDVRFIVSNSPALGVTMSYSTITWTLDYIPDIGNYNPALSDNEIAAVDDRIEDTSDYSAIEWHGNSSYTDLLWTGDGYTTSCPYGGSVTVWLRVKLNGDAFWSNVGSNTFTDTRGGL